MKVRKKNKEGYMLQMNKQKHTTRGRDWLRQKSRKWPGQNTEANLPVNSSAKKQKKIAQREWNLNCQWKDQQGAVN